ncbi:MAG: pyridoxal 5'-phosphate synthase, partial [Nocardioidaceae bacterium]
ATVAHMADSLDALSSADLHELAVKYALRHVDIGFFIRLLKTLPVAEAAAGLVDEAEADAYFASRPRGSQLGAWASPQSEIVTGRDYLNDRYLQVSERFDGVDNIPRPPHWGGYLVRPHHIEFWQGRPGRMHDRVRYDRADEATWIVERLAP